MLRLWFLNYGSNIREKEVKKNVLRNNVWFIREMILYWWILVENSNIILYYSCLKV